MNDELRSESRQSVRIAAGKVLRSDFLSPEEKESAVRILGAHPFLGNPHAVRCNWCNESRTLFFDESDGPFQRAGHGWLCQPCDVHASSQEIKF